MKKMFFVVLALVAVLGLSLFLAGVAPLHAQEPGPGSKVVVTFDGAAPAPAPVLTAACPDQGPLTGGFDFVLWLLTLAVPGAGWLASLAKARKVARVADGLTQVISRHHSPDASFLALAQSEELSEAAKAIATMMQAKGGA